MAKRRRIVIARRLGAVSSLKGAKRSATGPVALAKVAARRPVSPSTSPLERSTRSCLQRAFSGA
eukprot:804106-Pyramimonas_sp.AAC.1